MRERALLSAVTTAAGDTLILTNGDGRRARTGRPIRLGECRVGD